MMNSGVISKELRRAASRDISVHSAATACASFSRSCLLPSPVRSSPPSLSRVPVLPKPAGAVGDVSTFACCPFHLPPRESSLAAGETSIKSTQKWVFLRKKKNSLPGNAVSYVCKRLHDSSDVSVLVDMRFACAFSRRFSSSSSLPLSAASRSSHTKTSAVHTRAALRARHWGRTSRRPSASSFTSASYSSAAPAPSAAFSAAGGAGGTPPAAASPASSSTTTSPTAPASLPVLPATSPSAAASRGGEELQSFFARAELLAHLLHSRLALPLLYPFNSGGGLTHPLEQPQTHRVHSSPSSFPHAFADSSSVVGGGASSAQAARQRQPGGDAAPEGQQQRTAITSRWSRSAVLLGLAHVTPLVLAATKVANLLKMAHALSYYTGQAAAARQQHDQQRTVQLAFTKQQLLDSSATGSNGSPPKTKDGLSEGPTLPQGTLKQAQPGEQQIPPSSAGRKISPARRRKHQSLTYHPSMRSCVHFLRPQLWRVLKPGDEHRTKHLGWR